MDLVLLAASAFGGAVVTAAIGLMTFIMTGRREHRRWLYDLKYKNYLEVLRAWHNWERVVKLSADQRKEINLKIMELVAADLVLVYSLKVEQAFTTLVEEMVKQDHDVRCGERTEFDLEEHWKRLVNRMRKDLGIKGKINAGT